MIPAPLSHAKTQSRKGKQALLCAIASLRETRLGSRPLAQEILVQVDPGVVDRGLHEGRAVNREGMIVQEARSAVAGEFENRRRLLRGNLLGQGHVRMVGERLVELGGARVQRAVQALHLLAPALVRSQIVRRGKRECLDVFQLQFEWRAFAKD